MTAPAFLSGGGECGALMRTHDWSNTPLGYPDRWPAELQTLVGVMLGSKQPMFAAWGPGRAMLYNDAYSEIMGPARHPWGLGRDFDEVWSDILADVRPILDRAYAGEPSNIDDLQLAMVRDGRVEETHFAFSYTPVRDGTGMVAGMFCACTETTQKVFAERRLAGESERLRDMFRQAPGFMAIMRGPNHVFEFANESYVRLVGRRDIIGRSVAEALPEVVEQGFVSLLDEAYLSGEPFVGHGVEIELGGDAAPPQRRVLDFIYQPIRDAGAVVGIFLEGVDVTEQRRAEQSLLESAERLRLVQQAGGIGSFDWDIAAGVVHRSPEYLAVQGLPPDHPLDDAVSDRWQERLHPEDRERVIASLDASLARGGVLEEEYRIVRPIDGRTAWIHSRGRVDLDAAGRPVRLVSAQSDITARKQVEAALRESEARLRLAQEAAGLGSFDWNLRTGESQLSDTYRSILGFGPQEVIDSEALIARAHPDDRAQLEQEIRAIDGGVDARLSETRVLLPDGTVRWVQSRARTQFDADGKAVRRTGVIQDVTERREAEEALRASEARFRAAVRAVEGVVWTNSAEGEMLGEQPGWEALTGQTFEQYQGYGWADAVHPDDAQPTIDAWQAALADRRTFVFEHRVRTAAAGWRLFSIRAIPVFDDDGAITQWVGVHTDVTEIREAERALRDLNDTLEAHVENRTRDLEAAQEQLRQSQKMEAVGQLTGGIAHDFNNLLQGITGSLDLIKARIAQGRVGDLDRLITGAMMSANRAAALTHRLLAFSRRQPLDPKPVRANPLVAGMEDLLRRTLGERVELELVLAGGLWITLCDANQLENALLNLAINARDAMPEGGRLTIETCNAHLDSAYAAQQREVTPGQYVCICVSDTGVGMPPDVVARAFDPFFTTKPMGQETGLGLSMIYGFARQSEGYAKIYSEPGRGTTVKLYLPRHRGGAAVEDEADAVGPASSHDGDMVLVVEDEPVVRSLIVEALQEIGCGVLEAPDGPSGLDIVRSGVRIDLLLTDMGLPGMNGRDLATAARAERPGLRVLFMTGYAQNAALAGGFLDPGMAMITKPFAIDQLRARVTEMLESKAPVAL